MKTPQKLVTFSKSSFEKKRVRVLEKGGEPVPISNQ